MSRPPIPAKWLAAALPLVLLVALLLRLAAGAWWESRLPADARFGFGDSESYWTLAGAFAWGEPYQYGHARVARTPGYPLLLAPLFLFGDREPPVPWARAWSAVLATMAVGGLYWLGRELFDDRAALLAALLAAVYPGLVIHGALVLSEAPFTALLTVQLACWIRGYRAEGRSSAMWYLAAGAAGGAATLMRPSWLLFTPCAAALAVACVSPRGRQLRGAAWLMLGLIVVMTPWWVRNYRVVGRFVPTTLAVGASLYDGLNPQADGGSNMDFTTDFYRRLSEADARTRVPPPDTFEYRLDAMMGREAVAWATRHPGQVLRLAAVKFARMWNVWPNEGAYRGWTLRLVTLLTYTPLLLLGLCGAWRFARRGWPYVLCLLPAVYFSLIHMVFVSSLRYREPAMMLLIVLAAGWIAARHESFAPDSAQAPAGT